MRLQKQEEQDNEVKGDMTPMIDCVFLLLVFFMCATRFKTLEEKLVTHLPKNLGEQNVTPMDVQPRIIELKVQDRTEVMDNKLGRTRPVAKTIGVFYGDSLLDTYMVPSLAKDSGTRQSYERDRARVLTMLRDKLEVIVAEAMDTEKNPTIVKPELRVPMDDVVQAMDILVAAGIQNMSFSGHVADLEKVRREDGHSE